MRRPHGAGAGQEPGSTACWLRSLRRRGGQPVLDLSLLADASFRAGLAANPCFMAYFGSFMFVLTLFLQDGLRLDAFQAQAGLAFAPAGVTFSASALAGPRLLRRHGPQSVVASALTTAAALAGLGIVAHAGLARADLPWIIVCAAVASLGNGIVLPALIGRALVTITPQQAGAGAGVLATAQQFASSAGVAVIGTVFFALAGRSRLASGGYATAMTAATGGDLALVAAVAALIAWTSRRATDQA